MQIAFIDDRGGVDEGRIRIEFASAEIEDIRAKISKYTGELNATEVITSVRHDPSYYAAKTQG